MNAEEDEAGRLAAFRSRFGRGWDAAPAAPAAKAAVASAASTATADAAAESAAASDAGKEDALGEQGALEFEADEEEDNLLDLISSYGMDDSAGGKKK